MKLTRKFSAVLLAALLGVGLGIFRTQIDYPQPPAFWYPLLGGCFGIFALLALAFGKKPAPESFHVHDLFKVTVVLSGFLVLGGSALSLGTMLAVGLDLLHACGMGLMLLSGIGMILSLKNEGEMPAVFASIPVFGAGIYLLSVYKDLAAATPDIDLYACEILLVLCLTAALYAVACMRFQDRSQSFFVTLSILSAIFMAGVVGVSSLLQLHFPLTAAEVMLCIGFALWCGAWYLNPPVKYVVPEDPAASDEDGEEDDADMVIVPATEEE